MAEEAKRRQVRLRPEATEKGPAPIYANFVQVNHTPWDFTLHFGSFFIPPEVPQEAAEFGLEVKSVARITVPTKLIKAIVRAIELNIKRHEASFGAIPDDIKSEEEEEKEEG